MYGEKAKQANNAIKKQKNMWFAAPERNISSTTTTAAKERERVCEFERPLISDRCAGELKYERRLSL